MVVMVVGVGLGAAGGWGIYIIIILLLIIPLLPHTDPDSSGLTSNILFVVYSIVVRYTSHMLSIH